MRRNLTISPYVVIWILAGFGCILPATDATACFAGTGVTNVRVQELADGRVQILYDAHFGTLEGLGFYVEWHVDVSVDSGFTWYPVTVTGDTSCCYPTACSTGPPKCSLDPVDQQLIWNPRTSPIPVGNAYYTRALIRIADLGIFCSYCRSGFFALDYRIHHLPPTVVLTAPADGQAVGGSVLLNASVNLNGAQLASLEYDVDGVRVIECPTGVICNGSWDATGAAKGLHTIVAVATNTAEEVGRSAPVSVRVAAPIVKADEPDFGGFFLKGTALTNRFKATVDWSGLTPQWVLFGVVGGEVNWEPADLSGAKHDFKMASDFTAGATPSYVAARARSAQGIEGPDHMQPIWVFAYPTWLQDAFGAGTGSIDTQVGDHEVTYAIEFDYPNPHLARDGPIDIPSWVPFFGGKFGMTETYARAKGTVSSHGNGSVALSGKTGIQVGGLTFEGKATGAASLALGPPDGLSLAEGTIGLELGSTVEKSEHLVDIVPRLRDLENNQFVGQIIRDLDQSTELTASLSPRLALDVGFAENQASELEFKEGTGSVGISAKAKAAVHLSDDVKVEASVVGDAKLAVGVPEIDGHFARSLELEVDAKVKVRFDSLFNLVASDSYTVSCSWAGSVNCNSSHSGAATTALSAKRVTSATIRTEVASPLDGTVVTDVFDDARPQLVELPDHGWLLIWVRQNPSLPVFQSTDISWSIGRGPNLENATWSSPTVIAEDTRAELSPVAAIDSAGNVICAWLRVKDPAFSAPIETVTDLSRVYTQFEVVTATFAPPLGQWSAVTPLTDDEALDTDLRMSRDSEGRLMLTWLTNPAGVLTSTASKPSLLRASHWSGAAWSEPEVVASGLVGVATHVAAVHGASALVIISRATDSSGSALDEYEWSDNHWTGPMIFAAGGENRSPAVAYDNIGTGHVVWIQNGNIVHGTIRSPAPVVVRPGSRYLGFWDLQLLANPTGGWTLLFEKNQLNGNAGIAACFFNERGPCIGPDIFLNDDASAASQINARFGATGRLRIVYIASPEVPDGSEDRSDIRVAEAGVDMDLSVSDSDLTFNPPLPAIGQHVKATLDVHNTGDLVTPAFTVALYAGVPENGGTPLATSGVDGPIASGDHRSVTMNFVYLGGPVVAVVDVNDVVTESNENNNRAFAFGGKRRATKP